MAIPKNRLMLRFARRLGALLLLSMLFAVGSNAQSNDNGLSPDRWWKRGDTESQQQPAGDKVKLDFWQLVDSTPNTVKNLIRFMTATNDASRTKHRQRLLSEFHSKLSIAIRTQEHDPEGGGFTQKQKQLQKGVALALERAGFGPSVPRDQQSVMEAVSGMSSLELQTAVLEFDAAILSTWRDVDGFVPKPEQD